MFHLFTKQIDPAFNITATDIDDNIVLNAGNEIYNTLEYNAMYFTKDSFIAKAYVSDNGIIIVIPTNTDNLQEDVDEQKRLSASVKEIKEILKLHLYVIPIFVSENTYYFGRPVGDKLTKVQEISDVSQFVNNLLYGLNEYSLEIEGIGEEYFEEDLTVNAYYAQNHEEDEEYSCISKNLDEVTLKFVDMVCTKYEDNIRPTQTYRVDEDGQEWVCRNKAVTIKGLDTGLVHGKEWYKVTQDFDTEQMALMTTFLGWTGIHWFYLGRIKKAILYLITGGCFGILPFADLIQMATGSFTYMDVDYDSEPIMKRKGTKMVLVQSSEKIYFKKPLRWYATLLMSFVSLAIGLVLGCTVYAFIYNKLGLLGNDASIGVGNLLKNSGIIENLLR